MISPEFYKDSSNIATVFMGAKRPHFLPKQSDILLGFYPYTLTEGDTLYTLAANIFGPTNSRLWTFLSDGNRLRMIGDWEKEEVIDLPIQIVFTSAKAQ